MYKIRRNTILKLAATKTPLPSFLEAAPLPLMPVTTLIAKAQRKKWAGKMSRYCKVCYGAMELRER